MSVYMPLRGAVSHNSGFPYFNKDYEWKVAKDGKAGKVRFSDKDSAVTFIEILESDLPHREKSFVSELCLTFPRGTLR